MLTTSPDLRSYELGSEWSIMFATKARLLSTGCTERLRWKCGAIRVGIAGLG